MRDKRKQPRAWTTPGRGRKMCPGCHAYIGSRSAKCPCGHRFEAKAKARPDRARGSNQGSKYRSTEDDTDRRPHLATPVGKCPVDLTGTGLATVQIWMQDVAKIRSKERLMPSCFTYWARSYFSIGSTEYKTVVEHIDRCAKFATGSEPCPK